MAGWKLNRVFVAGVVSPVVSIALYIVVYSTLTSASHNLNRDWLFRLSVSALAMILPSIFVFVLGVKESRRSPLTMLSKVGIGIAVLALGLAARPIADGILRSRQERNMAMHDVAAPQFEAADFEGNTYRLTDQKGKVVLVNRWATWCGPCLVEMPQLEKLYQERKDKGLIVLGLSDQEVAAQRRFLQKTPVTYPLLTMGNGVPGFYRDIVKFPATFLIDREGRLRAIPSTDGSFEGIKNSVDELLTQSGLPNKP